MKIGTSPITNTIYVGSTRKPKNGPEVWIKKEDVTDSAVEAVLDHMIGQKDFKKNHFFGYTYTKTEGGTLTIMAFDDTHDLINLEKYNEFKTKANKLDKLISLMNKGEVEVSLITSDGKTKYKDLLNESELNELVK